MTAREAREALTSRLRASGFEIDETTVAASHALVARRAEFRWEWFASSIHTFVVVLHVPRLNDVVAEELTDAAQRYAIRRKGGLPRRMQTGTATVALLLADEVESSARSWVTREPHHRFAALRFPVVVGLETGSLPYFRGRMKRGYIFGEYLRSLLEDVIRPALPRSDLGD